MGDHFDVSNYDPRERWKYNPASPGGPHEQFKQFRERKAKEKELMIAAAREAEEEEERKKNRIKRNYTKHDWHPGQVVGKLTLIDHDWQDGLNGRYSNGYWMARCACGATVRVHTSWMRIGLRKGLSCEDCFPPSEAGRPPLKLTGMTVGRLKVKQWVPGMGWLCGCGECGGELLAANSSQVKAKGTQPCKGECVV